MSQRHSVDVALSDEAINWLVKLQSGRATSADQAAFVAWRHQSEDHERAAQEAEMIWQDIGLVGGQLRKAEGNARLTRRTLLGGAGLALVGAGFFKSGLFGRQLFADYATGVGERRSVNLPDGSMALLNAGTALDIDFKDNIRRLTLYEGQATFKVAHDATRPFVVEAGGGRTQAIGTVFDVDIRSHEIAVTVVEGSVAVTTDADRDKPVMAGPNQSVRYASYGPPSQAETVDAAVETAWQRGKLIFNGRPLGDVIGQIERYGDSWIVIANPQLASLQVTGVFETADPDAVLRTIEKTLGIRITRLPFVTILR